MTGFLYRMNVSPQSHVLLYNELILFAMYNQMTDIARVHFAVYLPIQHNESLQLQYKDQLGIH